MQQNLTAAFDISKFSKEDDLTNMKSDVDELNINR